MGDGVSHHHLSTQLILIIRTKVHTCQKPQPTRCGFFLWDEEAKPREAAVLLNNSRSEPPPTPQTPSKLVANTGYLTPQTEIRARPKFPDTATPYTPSRTSGLAEASRQTVRASANSSTQDDSEEEFFDWPLTDDEDLSKVVESASSQAVMPPPETPRKAVKTDTLSTAGKRMFEEIDTGNPVVWSTPESLKREDDVFTAPATMGETASLFLPAIPQDTPTPVRFKDIPFMRGGDSSLAAEIMATLKSAQISLPISVREDIKAICDKRSLYTHGVIKGRDVSRSLIAKKDAKIADLQGSIEALQAERETSRAVIRHLRKELGATKSNI